MTIVDEVLWLEDLTVWRSRIEDLNLVHTVDIATDIYLNEISGYHLNCFDWIVINTYF